MVGSTAFLKGGLLPPPGRAPPPAQHLGTQKSQHLCLWGVRGRLHYPLPLKLCSPSQTPAPFPSACDCHDGLLPCPRLQGTQIYWGGFFLLPTQGSLRKWHQKLLGHRAQECSAITWEIKVPLSPGWEGPKLSPRLDPEAQKDGPGTPNGQPEKCGQEGLAGGWAVSSLLGDWWPWLGTEASPYSSNQNLLTSRLSSVTSQKTSLARPRIFFWTPHWSPRPRCPMGEATAGGSGSHQGPVACSC